MNTAQEAGLAATNPNKAMTWTLCCAVFASVTSIIDFGFHPPPSKCEPPLLCQPVEAVNPSQVTVLFSNALFQLPALRAVRRPTVSFQASSRLCAACIAWITELPLNLIQHGDLGFCISS